MRHTKSRRREGNALLMTVLLIAVLTAISSAQFAIVFKNSQQSRYMAQKDDLLHYAEGGTFLSLHDLRWGASQGIIGTTGWTTANDWGRDGLFGTYDEGEGDGYPTPGEPNVSPVSIGPAADNVGLVVHTEDSPYPKTKRVVSVAYTDESMTVVESYAWVAVLSIPDVGAIYVEPGVVLDLKGNSFVIDGTDTNPDGTPGPDAPLHGITTTEGAVAGDAANNIIDQIPSASQDQVLGDGTTPSVGETTAEVDIETMFNSFKKKADVEYASGTYSNVSWGNSSAYEITYVAGDTSLAGSGSGAGILLVDGNLSMSGSFTYEGLVIVRGDVRQTGGGSSVRIFGSLLVSSTFALIDDPELTVSGTADLKYSSLAIGNVENLIRSKGLDYRMVYWNAVK